MKTKLKILVAISLIILITLIYYTVQKINIKDEQKLQSQEPTSQQETTIKKESPAITVEGLVISLSDKYIAISNNTSEPEQISISSTTPVIKIDKEKKETTVTLSEIKPAQNAKVLFDQKDSSEEKIARTIYLIEE